MKIGLLILVIVLIAGGLFYLQNKAITSPISLTSQPLVNISPSLEVKNDKLKTHTSKDLKISFKYPKEWYVDDRYQIILITNYISSLNKNKAPKSDQIEIIVKNASLCFEDIEKNLIYGGCGENQQVLNKIKDKKINELVSGKFYMFLVQFPDNSESYSYYLQKGDGLLQISKQPDPSQFEKEFEGIINSIEFI